MVNFSTKKARYPIEEQRAMMWSRRESNPGPAKETNRLSTCLFAFDFREAQGQQQA